MRCYSDAFSLRYGLDRHVTPVLESLRICSRCSGNSRVKCVSENECECGTVFLVLVVTLAPGLFPLETPESFPLSTAVGVRGVDGWLTTGT